MGSGGIIGLFVRHRNASNLLMIGMILAGLFALGKLNTQFFPTIGIDFIRVAIVWPGASAADVESNIVNAIDREVRHLDSVKRVVSFAREGVASVLVEFETGASMDTAYANVEAAISRITTFPEDSEEPQIQRVIRYDTISRIVVSGAIGESALKTLAKQLRDDLIARGIDQVALFGAREDELWVEVDPKTLRRLDLSLGDIAQRIQESSQDQPSGTLGGRLEKQIRSLGLAKDARAIGGVEIRATDSGEKIYLRDIAILSDNFAEDNPVGLRNGRAAIELHIQRATSADALEVAAIVARYIEEIRGTLPPTVQLETFDVQASLIRDRINLLLRNGVSGLILVLLVLFLFLDVRVAMWVAIGVPTAFLATLAFMLASGQTINMLSLFALIMMLGIIVDDAIVVGEHSAALRTRGLSPVDAAAGGAQRMLAPVMAASLTTIAAFLPILMIGDVIGQVVQAIPMVVVAVLIASLIECFFVLPGHMRASLPRDEARRLWGSDRFDGHFDRFSEGPFRRLVELAVLWRYTTVAIALAMLILSLGIVAGGRIGFQFFPAPETDTIFANVVFAPGTERRVTEEMIRELESAMLRTEEKLGDGPGSLVASSFGRVGVSQGEQFRTVSGDHLGGVHAELIPSDQRDVRTPQFIDAWRDEVRSMAGLERVSVFAKQVGPPGREIDIRFTGGSAEALKMASLEVRNLLTRYPGVSDIEDDLPYGRNEVLMAVTPRGRALGFTTESVSRQVRDAYEGRIAKKFARGDTEVTVRVQYARDKVASDSLRNLYLRGPRGADVALSEVVTFTEKSGFARIRREDGVRQIAIVGEIDEAVTSSQAVLGSLVEGGLDEIAERYGLSYRFAGRAEEQAQTMADMKLGAMIALASIFIILAWVFASYVRPLIVMAIIPFGLVGAIIGHLIMGYDLTVLSLISLLGLSGILVNDSIILVTTIERRRAADNEALLAAVVRGTQDRLRAVLLTSLTTIGGLLPLLFETSLQARFMIPMAVTIVFGLFVATMLVLLLVPALFVIQHDAAEFVARLRGRKGAPLGAPKTSGE